MKTFVVLFIMASVSFKLNAFDFNNPELKNIEELIKNTNDSRELFKNDPNSNFYYRLEREEELRSDRTCSHCPKYLLLTEAVNNLVDKMAKDPKTTSDELPMKINKLKFMFYTQALREQDGTVRCKRFLDLTPDLKPTKFDGQFKLIAEDALKFNAVTEVHYMNPDAEETVYYYRGEGEEKNIIVQAIMTKEGGKLRYFRYTPSESEANPYNLPDMPSFTGPKYEARPADGVDLKDAVDGAQASGDEKYKLKFKAEVEKRNKFIPKNVHFVEASIDQDLIGEMNLKASSDVSLKGNQAHLAVKREGSDLVLIDVDTKLNGETKHKVTVPFSVRVFDDLPGVQGKAETGNSGQVLNLTLVDKGIDLVRSEFRRNAETGATSYVLARDVALDKNEVVSMQYGRGEDNRQYASVKHVKSLQDNVTLVLDVRVDQDRKASLFYQVSAKF